MKTTDQLLQALGDGPKNEWDINSVDWTLNSDSIVVEVGAYKGRWAKAIYDLYQCNVFAFEPQFWAYEIARTLLDPFDKVKVYNYGLGVKTGTFEMGEYETDGCSFLKAGERTTGTGKMQEIKREFLMLGISYVDVMLINIEGYEYTLLPYMINLKMLDRIDNLIVQFHQFAAEDNGHQETLNIIGKTHKVLWHYPALTAWTRK